VKGIPKPLWAYAVVSFASGLIGFVQIISAHAAAALGTTVFFLIIVVLVLRGSRVVWSLVVAATLLSLIISPFATQSWWAIVLGIISLACLLAPASRSFIWRSHPAQVARPIRQTTLDPDGHSELDRPAGWYVDPSSPERMRYWSANDARWLGSTKTPRKVKQAWRAQAGD
jgi:hypothetical protein